MFTMVKNYLERDSKLGNYIVEKEAGGCINFVIECGHGFCPFFEVFECDYDILVPITGWGVESHEINAPLTKGDYRNDWMER
jgi:hypothetical protein